MIVYLGRFQEWSTNSAVITQGINTSEYQSNPIYRNTTLFTSENILSGLVNDALLPIKRLELSHLARVDYRDVCVYLMRLVANDSRYQFDLYVPEIAECMFILDDKNVVSKIFRLKVADDVENPDAIDSYDIPDEVYQKKNVLSVAANGDIYSSSGRSDSMYTISCIDYGTYKGLENGPYIRIVNDNDYLEHPYYCENDYTVSRHGNIDKGATTVWDNLNRIGMHELSIGYFTSKGEFGICRRNEILSLFRNKQKGYVRFTTENSIDVEEYSIISRVKTYPLDSAINMLFARIVCRNHTKINPDLVCELVFDGATLPIECSDDGTIRVDKFTFNWDALKEYAEELEMIERKGSKAEVSIHIKAETPKCLYDKYVCTLEKEYEPKELWCSKVMNVTKHPIQAVLDKVSNNAISDTLFVDFSDSECELDYANELLAALEKAALNNIRLAYKEILIKPGSLAERVFEHVIA